MPGALEASQISISLHCRAAAGSSEYVALQRKKRPYCVEECVTQPSVYQKVGKHVDAVQRTKP